MENHKVLNSDGLQVCCLYAFARHFVDGGGEEEGSFVTCEDCGACIVAGEETWERVRRTDAVSN